MENIKLLLAALSCLFATSSFAGKIVVPHDAAGRKIDICLNGPWKFQLGNAKMKVPEFGHGKWIDLPVPSIYTSRRIKVAEFPQVPLKWRSIKKKKVGWYYRTIYIPKSLSGRRFILKLGMVSFAADVFVNGKHCGEHIGPHNAGRIDVTAALKTGADNSLFIAIRSSAFFRIGRSVADSVKRYPGVRLNGNPIKVNQQGEVKSAKKRIIYAYPNPTFHNPDRGLGMQCGIAGDVILEAISPEAEVALQKVETIFNGGKRITVKTWIENTSVKSLKIILKRQIFDRNGKAALVLPEKKIMVQPGKKAISQVSQKWTSAKLWGIGGKYGTPYLYSLKSQLIIDDKVIDSDLVKFGFRQMGPGNPRFKQNPFKLYLNGREIFLQADCIGWTSNGIHAWNRPFFEKLFAIYQEMGVNYVRPHTHQLMPPLFYDVADEMGMMIASQFPLDRDSSPYLDWRIPKNANPKWKQYYVNLHNTMKRWIELSWNHPSIVAWVPENEVISHIRLMPDRAAGLKKLNRFLRSIDNTRMIYNEGSRSMDLAGSETSMAGIHYPFGRRLNDNGTIVGSGQSWQKAFNKPVHVGEDVEWDAFLRNFEIRGNKYKKQSEEEKDMLIHGKGFQRRQALAKKMGFSGYSYWNISLYAFGGGKVRGPWNIEFPRYIKIIKVTWPALSGYGSRVPTAKFGVKHAIPKINWFDPDKPLFTPSSFYPYVKEVWGKTQYTPKTQGKMQLSPQVIVNAGKAFAWVSAVPLDKSSGNIQVLQADAEGRAWFTLPEAGKYKFVSRDKEITSVLPWLKKVDFSPGYKYINRLNYQK
jgi:glycosyl hydrolase family 2